MPTADLAEPRARILFLYHKLWGGSQTRMARDTGISQSAISRFITGDHEPGGKLLAAVAAHPAVNASWALNGVGEPLIVLGVRALHVATQLFAGRPEDHPDCLGEMREVVTRRYRPSRYWVRIDAENALLGIEELRLEAGDHLLLDSDSEGWPRELAGAPCIAYRDDEPSTLEWGVAVAPGMTRLAREQVPKMKGGRSLRPILLDGDDAIAESATPTVVAVAVAVHLDRAFGGA